MKLKKLTIKGLYGLDYDLEFNEDISLLYGLNGSGKTTILNIIYHLLNGEIIKVIEYDFVNISLDFIVRDEPSKISIGKSEEKVVIDFNGDKETLHIGLSPEFINERRYISDNEMLESSDLEKHYYRKEILRDLRAKSIPLSKKFSNFKYLFDTLYIPINRKVQGINNRYSSNVKSQRIFRDTNRRNIEQSLLIAQNFFNDYINIISLEEKRIINVDRGKMLQKIAEPINERKIVKMFNEDLGLSLSNKENALHKAGVGDIQKLIKAYNETSNSFHLNDESNKYDIVNPTDFIRHSFTAAQMIKIIELSEITEKSTEKINSSKLIKNMVIDSINELFSETGKRLGYNDETRELYFIVNDNWKQKLEIEYLSSGEKQVLIFFIFSLINSSSLKGKKSKILLIDEPELSLHIEWQIKLLSKLELVTDHTQFIIATHSPDIIGDKYNKMVEVKGVRNH